MSKIIFFVTNLNSGGLENYLLRFLKEYSSEFEEVIVYCKGGKGGVLEDDYLSIPNIKIFKKHIGNYHVHHYLSLFRWLKKHSDFSVCDFTGNFSGLILFVSKMTGVRKRIVFYRSSSNRFKETFLRLLINRLYNRLVIQYATDILANSNFGFEFYFGIEKIDNRFKIIYNGINADELNEEIGDIREELGIGKSKIVIGHTGRFNPAKNHETIIKVAESVIKSNSNVCFVLCGSGVRDNLLNKVSVLNRDKNIFLLENRRDIPKVLNSFDIYYFPSITEGQPNALIEAWIKGIPFLASNIKPIKDIVPKEFYSYLSNPLDIEKQIFLINQLIQSQWSQKDRVCLSNYAIKKFDSKIRFKEFLDIIKK